MLFDLIVQWQITILKENNCNAKSHTQTSYGTTYKSTPLLSKVNKLVKSNLFLFTEEPEEKKKKIV